jgi:hypothetical protein
VGLRTRSWNPHCSAIFFAYGSSGLTVPATDAETASKSRPCFAAAAQTMLVSSPPERRIALAVDRSTAPWTSFLKCIAGGSPLA